jgi:ABC-type glycerol-3-phosphate transport system permease component
MKKSSLFLLGMLALALTFGLVFSGCPTEDEDSSSGPVIPANLVGSWGGSVNYPALTINADGSGYYLPFSSGAWSVIGTTLTFTDGNKSGSVTYSVLGDKLYLSDPTGELAYSLSMLVSQSPLDRITSTGGDDDDDDPVANIDPALFGTWKDTSTSGSSVTVTFSSLTITWGGSMGDALNTSLAAYQGAGYTYAWTAKNGEIFLTCVYQGGTPISVPVYTYTLAGGNLELKLENATFATLTK